MTSNRLLVRKTLTVQKSQSIKMIGAYSMCFIFVIMQVFFATNYTKQSHENMLQAYGSQDGLLVNCPDINNLNTQDISANGEVKVFAQHTASYFVYNNTVRFGFADTNFVKINNLTLLNGTLPQNYNEIVIEESANSILRKSLKINDTFSIDVSFLNEYGEYVSTNTAQEFKVVGIIKNYTDTQWNDKSASLLPNILVSKAFFDQNSIKSISIQSIVLNQNTKANEFFNDTLITNNYCSEYITNTEQNSATQVDESVKFISISAVILFGLFTIILLLSLQSLCKINQQKLLGILQAVELNRKEIYKYFLTVQMLYLLFSFFTALPISLLFIWLIKSKLYANAPSDIINIVYYLLSVIAISTISLVLTYSGVKKQLSYSSVENINNTDKETIKKNLHLNIKNPSLFWAVKNYYANPSAFSGISIMLVFVILLSVLGGTAINLMNTTLKNTLPSDIVVSVYDGQFYTDLQIPAKPSYGIQNNDLQYIQESPDIKKQIPLRNLQVNYKWGATTTSDQYLNDLWNSEPYRNALSEYNYEENTKLKSTFLFSTDNNALNELKSFENIEGNIDIDALQSGKEIVICKVTEQINTFKVGDTISFTQIINNTENISRKIDFDVKVGAIITFQESEKNSFLADAFGDRMIWGDASYENLNVELNTNLLYIQLNSVEQYMDLDTRLNSIMDNYKDGLVLVDMFFQQSQLQQQMLKLVQTAIIVSITLLSLFMFISLYVSHKLRFKQQKNIFGSLRSIGMNKQNVYSIFFFENIIQFIFSIIVGCVVSGIILFLLKYILNLGQLITINLPFFLLSLLILLFFLVLSPIIPTMQFFKEPIMSNIRED